MTRNEEYWQRRAAQRMFEHMQDAEDAADQIAALYRKASRYLSAKADGIFEKYQTKYGLSDAETRRLINALHDKASLDELLQKLQASESSHKKEELRKQLEAPAYQVRLDRLQQLQNQLDLVMRNVYQQEKDFSTSFYTDLAQEAYYRSMFDIQQRAGVAPSFAHIDPKQIDRVINSKWSGKNYSSRIWGNTRALAQDLKEELLINLVTGRTEREVAGILANKFAQSASKARRLVRTESCFLSNQMEMESYKACGIERYRYLATLDLRTSAICRSLDGKVFLVAEQQPGKNCPPMHPWCRSTTTAYISADDLDGMQRRARDPVTGKTYLVPATMTYPEWYEKYVREETEKKSIAKSVDSGIIKQSITKEDEDVAIIRKLGRIDTASLESEFGKIQTDEIIVTDERLRHIRERHPEDYDLFEKYGKDSVENPDFIIKDSKHDGTVFMVRKLQETNLNVVVRVVLETDENELKNSVMTFYRIRERNLKKLIDKNSLLYKNE